MSTATIKMYDILVEKGVDKATAREAVDEFLSKEEARLSLATKEDLGNLKSWMAMMLIGQAAVIVALIEIINFG